LHHLVQTAAGALHGGAPAVDHTRLSSPLNCAIGCR
jgi:hypothetical protein